ncbi:EAL domain-containing protein [Blautia sp. MSJ-19]|uniref:EAL domain-containing protein n=1 Tax=Blautia sp. MSJ-19 TaxID=2841517 RepID=UPI001C0EDA28|nr:EAL domain-containing protein [Blautia sp. MSJ-19]MBU5482478.1 EAL domain-containing protein [Blautia sp. MSJ-19]
MKKSKNILYLCELTLGIMVALLFTNLYLSRKLPLSSPPIHRLFQLTSILLIFIVVLILIQREMLSRLLVNAFRDITGVHNKKSLEKKIQELSSRPDTFDIGVMMFDLNNLKYVNDTFGHEKGDEFIQAFTYCLTRILNEHSFLARYGGDEFVLIQENTNEENLKQLVSQLDKLVQEYNSHSSLPLSYAVGYEVSYRNHYFMMEDLMQTADKKMYEDKAQKKLHAMRQPAVPGSSANKVIPTVTSEFLLKKIQQIQDGTASSQNIALVSTDVENFHFINDKYGYSLGNEILNIVYEELASAPSSLFTARFFSDVFVSIVDTTELSRDTFLEEIQALDSRICERVQNTYHISFFRTNSGICYITKDAAPENMISCANVARRIAKKMVSHSCIYSPEIDQQEKVQAEILHSFHQAVANGEFRIYLQPKVLPQNGKISSAEVLVRWVRDGRLFLSPAVYIPLFEQNGFVIDLDYYVYEKTFQWLRTAGEFLPDNFRVSLNVSPLHFEQPQVFIDKIQELIRQYEIAPSRLTFEITESTYVNNTAAVNQVIHTLQRQKIQISMDDFGSGYSSLNTLKDLRFDEVKIDRKFLGDSLNENAQIVLEEMFHMLKRMNKTIVCEGVETETIADFLKNEGCNEIQGFLYYRPMCIKDFETVMQMQKAI